MITVKYKSYVNLIIWILSLILIGSAIGSLTKPEIGNWYSGLNRSSLTPPNYLFPIAWTILYAAIGACGSVIWNFESFSGLNKIKALYIIQLFLNWIWTPLFFTFHMTGLSLLVLIFMDIIVAMIIYLSYSKLKTVSFLMIPYLLWIIFATYLNLYIWLYN